MVNKTNEAENIRIGKLLQTAREKKGVMQSEISTACGLSKNHVSAVERGVSKASVEMLLGYCEMLKVTPNDILEVGLDKKEIVPELQELLNVMNTEQQMKVVQIIKLMMPI